MKDGYGLNSSADPGGDDDGNQGDDGSSGTNSKVTYYGIDCGSPAKTANLTSDVAGFCAEVRQACSAQADEIPPAQLDKVREVATVAHQAGQPDQLANTECAVAPARGAPVVTAGVARAEMVRLLPRPGLGVAPVDHVTLVHIDTIFWVATSAELDLGSATLLGQRVSLRAHLLRVEWDFGDGTSVVAVGPGKAYTSADPCRTVRCPDYFSHSYDVTGTDRVGARLRWAGQFRVGGGAWQDIAETVSVESPGTTVRVRAARGVLIPNP